MSIEIENKIKDLAEEIGEVYKENNWLVVKKYILKYLNPKHRKLFSIRESKSKKHIINDYEMKIIDFYENRFDIRLVLENDKKLR